MKKSLISNKTVVCIVGLGYVGLPLAEAFSRSLKVIGFDVDTAKVAALTPSHAGQNLSFTSNASDIKQADFIIICVPTPISESKEPDLSYVKAAARTVSQNMKPGGVVILESTVYPGVTEEVVKPILEESGLKCGTDFKLAYCPERINPGDPAHGIDKITKVVSGIDKETTGLVAELYRKIAPEVFQAPDIKTAEAAKVIENIQRDLNIALMNELSLIFDRMGLNTRDVLDTAATKWNFHRYSPGLVGGHCIPVVPYYLVHKARELGYQPRVILAGRAINDDMPRQVAGMTLRALSSAGKMAKGAKVLIMGLTYKENVPDTRETPAKEIIAVLKDSGVEVWGYDPFRDNIEAEFGIKAAGWPPSTQKFDAVMVTVGHDSFREMTLDQVKSILNNRPVLIDIRGLFSRQEAESKGFIYRSL